MPKKKSQTLIYLTLGMILLLAFLSTSKRPIFIGALTSFTQTGNELKFTDAEFGNETIASISRNLILNHGNVTNAYIDVFATPSILSGKLYIEGNLVWSQTNNESMINVERVDITSALVRDNCDDCVVDFEFTSEEKGSIIVTELNVDYGSNPNQQSQGTGPDPIQIDDTQQDQQPVQQQQQVETIETVQEKSINSQKILFILIIASIFYILWENGPKRGFFKSI